MDATKDILQGKWHELKGQARQQWAKLTYTEGARSGLIISN